MQSVRQRFRRSGLFLFVLIGVLLGTTILTQTTSFAQSADTDKENYQYIPADNTIRVTGGIAGSGQAIGLTCNAEARNSATNSGDLRCYKVISIPGSISRNNGSAEPCSYTFEINSIEGDLQAGQATGTVSLTRAGVAPTCRNGGTIMEREGIAADATIINRASAVDQIPAGCDGSTQTLAPGAQAPSAETCEEAIAAARASGNAEVQEPDICPIDKRNAFRWFFCPFTDIAQSFANGADYFIEKYLRTDNQIFMEPGQEGYQAGYRNAWETFRAFGIALVVIAGIVMVASEALNLNFVDAYTVRKVLPRLLVAVIGIAVSWDLSRFLVGFFDTLGHAASSIIYSSFQQDVADNAGNLGGSFLVTALSTIGLGAAAVGASVAAPLLGALGVMAILAAIVLAVLVGMVIVLARQAIIVVCILLAPLAIAAYILPNTNKLANFWWNTFLSMLLLYPIATGLIALCKALGMIASNNTGDGSGGVFATITGIILYFLGYFLFPLAFRLAGGLIAAIYNMGKSGSGGAFKMLSNFRNNRMKQRYNEARLGGGDFAGSKYASRMIQRATLRGGLTPTKRGRANFKVAQEHIAFQQGADAQKNDNGFAGNDELRSSIAMKDNMTAGRFLKEYQQGVEFDKNGVRQMPANVARDQALEALATVEKGFGGRIGTQRVQSGARRAYFASKKAHDHGDAGTPEDIMRQNIRSRLADGVMAAATGGANLSEVVGLTKGSARTELSGSGTSSYAKFVSQGVNNYKSGARAPEELVPDAVVEELLNEVLVKSTPDEWLKAPKESQLAAFPAMKQRLDKVLNNPADADALEKASVQLTNLMGIHEGSARLSEESREIFRKLMSETRVDNTFGKRVQDPDGTVRYVTGDTVTYNELMRRARDHKADDITGKQTVRDARYVFGPADGENYERQLQEQQMRQQQEQQNPDEPH